ncbi:helix-turn-helix transcriptional regulator [Heliobacterium chlorum]|uniref:Helix-turn-helix transcriptional regulator n=1 Tax=Heliobacterium chlorum TaxID=2698 RepID=A0ABR7SYF9_HELCL|nr:helix-turn-helix transcriptional regulator [Heliobacterium chlorum]MBC9783569.1 helix-turn-helix transcriptional regulator [Heliobacterium chlorum]
MVARRKAIEHALVEKEWNYSDLARAIDVTPSTIQRIVTGERDPSLRLALAISKALSKTVNELFDDESPSE